MSRLQIAYRCSFALYRAVASSSTPFLSHSSRPRFLSSDSKTRKSVEEMMPIATGYEREELQAEIEGTKRFDMEAPCGPFGTKEAPAVIQSYFDKRIVGCPGDEGDGEHDVIWFWLEKDKPFVCPICSQYFVLEIVGPGLPADGHGFGDDDDLEDDGGFVYNDRFRDDEHH